MSLTSQTNDQFQHTLKWNMMLQHFYDNISLKRRKIGPEQTCMCFTGANAVSVLFAFLKKNPTLFQSCDAIKRSNIISLCNLYLQTGNIETVNHCSQSPRRRNKFKDSSSSYYRFTENAMSTLVQFKQKNSTLKRTGRGKVVSLDICSQPISVEALTSLPLSKHDSLESVFERIHKSCLQRVNSRSKSTNNERHKRTLSLSFSPRCLKKVGSFCYDFGSRLNGRSVVNNWDFESLIHIFLPPSSPLSNPSRTCNALEKKILCLCEGAVGSEELIQKQPWNTTIIPITLI